MPKLVNHYQFLQEAFSNRKGWGSSESKRDENGKKQGLITHHTPLSDNEFINLHKREDKILYARMGKTTKVLIIDIDKGSPYHYKTDYRAWLGVINTIENSLGIKGIVTESSAQSKGCHIIFPLKHRVNSDRLAKVVHDLFVNNGYTLRRGDLEIFPNVRSSDKAMFNLIKVPGQNDWGLFISKSKLNLAKSTLEQLETRWKNYQEQNDLSRVLGRVEHEQERISEVTPESYETPSYKKTYYPQPKCKERSFKVAPWQELFPQTIKGMFAHLRCILKTGFTDRHQTNELISKITRLFYIILGRTDVNEISTIIRALKGFKDYCGHQNEIEKKVAGFIKITTNNEKYYTQRNEEMVENHNAYIGKDIDELLKSSANREKYSAKNVQNRIEAACQQINEMNDPQLQVRYHYVAMLSKVAHMSISTINKHWDELVKPFFILLANKTYNDSKPNISKGCNVKDIPLTKFVVENTINNKNTNNKLINNTGNNNKSQENSTPEEIASRGYHQNLPKVVEEPNDGDIEERADGTYKFDGFFGSWYKLNNTPKTIDPDIAAVYAKYRKEPTPLPIPTMSAPKPAKDPDIAMVNAQVAEMRRQREARREKPSSAVRESTVTSLKTTVGTNYHPDPDIALAQRKLDEERNARAQRYADREKEKLALLIQLEAEERRQREEKQEEQMHQRLMRKLGARC